MEGEAGGQGSGQVQDVLANEVGRLFFEFLDGFHPSHNPTTPRTPMTPASEFSGPPPIYVEKLLAMKDAQQFTISVDFSHILQAKPDLAAALEEQYFRFIPYLHRAAFEFVLKHQPTEARNQDGKDVPYYVAIYNFSSLTRLRDLRTQSIGRLLSVCGTVTRTSEVRPELLTGSFACGDCGNRIDGVDSQFRYTEPNFCAVCNNKKTWKLDVERSHFVDWQRVRVQERPDEIPPGSMPRTLDVILRGDAVESAKAGDIASFTGTVVVIPEPTTLAAAGERISTDGPAARGLRTDGVTGVAREFGTRELNYRMCLLATHVSVANNGAPENEAAILEQMSPEEQRDIHQMSQSPNLYQKMVDSMAPNVFGHADVKRGVLLMLFGGVHKTTREGISLRGDINTCIVGDPSCAKSQFLKYVVNFVPRAVYTSGKASSAAGLTASVAKDEDTGEFCIEAGALMLADNGICCIDEFDKMDIKDQVAIHEAMEQQTISITKAGVQATLNARTSILAAANPIGGRYDVAKTLRQNVAMTPPIMSRFDLFFVILDESDQEVDHSIASFIVRVHQHKDAAVEPTFKRERLQNYLRFARTIQPEMNPAASTLLVSYYKKLRQNDVSSGGRSAYRITVRQLESLIRLSEALARLHLDPEVKPKYVHEAARLLQKSILHVDSEDVVLEADEDDEDGTNNEKRVVSQSSDADEEEGANGENKTAHATRDGGTERETALPESSGLEETVVETENASSAAAGSPHEQRQVDSDVPAKKKEPLKINYTEFRAMCNKLVVHLRAREESGGDYRSSALSRMDLVKYLLQCQESSGVHLETEDALHHEVKRMKLVVSRLVKKDRVLLELPGQDPGLSRDDRLVLRDWVAWPFRSWSTAWKMSTISCAEDLLRHGIETSLGYFLDSNAVFLGERLLAMNSSEENAALLATAHLRSGNPIRAVTVLQRFCERRESETGLLIASAEARFIYASALVALDRQPEAERALRDGPPNDGIAGGAAGLHLLAGICQQTRRSSEALDLYRQALSLNPTLWCSFEALAALGHGQAALSAFRHSDEKILGHLRQQALPLLSCTSNVTRGPNPKTDLNPMETGEVTPALSNHQLTPRKRTVSPRVTPAPGFSLASPEPYTNHETPQAPPAPLRAPSLSSETTPSSQVITQNTSPALPPNPNRRVTRSISSLADATPPRGGSVQQTPQMARRSGRHVTDIARGGSAEIGATENVSESVEALSNRLKLSVTTESPQNLQLSAMQLLRHLAHGITALCLFKCAEALKTFIELPQSQLKTGFVLSAIGRAQMELYNYREAEIVFKMALEVDPSRTEGLLEYYSTALWQMRKEYELADLAKTAISLDRRSAAVWCVVGNCFSLQKDQDMSLRFLKRSTQLNPRMAYAYTLQGHEYAMKEDFDAAESSYRQAVSLDERHYNAWYGIGNVYNRREKYEIAEQYYRKALRIHPESSTLNYHLGLMLNTQGKYEQALKVLDFAVSLDDSNPVTKFERARVFAAMGHAERALNQLKRLNETLPREATVYYEMGKLYQANGDKGKATRCFALALDLEPKEQTYKKAMDSMDDGEKKV